MSQTVRLKMRYGLLIVLSLFAAPSAQARFKLSVLKIRANAVMYSQASGGSLITGQFNWNPVIELSDRFSLVGNLGGSFLNSGDQKFFAPSYQGFLKIYLKKRFALEVGGGIENWQNHGGSNQVLSANLSVDFPASFKKLQYFFVGYSQYALPNNPTVEYKAGVVVNFSKK